MTDINHLTITGRLVADPVVTAKPNGHLFGLFSLASNRRYQSGGETKTETAFLTCKIFGNWARALEGLKKGDPLLVIGRLRTEKWEQNGQVLSRLALICDSLRFIKPREKSDVDATDAAPF